MLFVNADREYREGRAQNFVDPEHIEKIVSAYAAFSEVPGFAIVVDVRTIVDAESGNLNLRRYVDSSPPPEPHDVRAHVIGGVPVTEIDAIRAHAGAQGLALDDATTAASQAFVYHGLDPRAEGPLFGILRMRLGSEDHDAEIAELAARAATKIKSDAAVQGYWDNAVAQEAARREIVQLIDNSNLFPFADLDAISADCMGVARANRGAFGP